MRAAVDNEWTKLSEWRKIEIKNDTLYFTGFGEYRDKLRATIKYIENNKIEFYNLDTNFKFTIEPIEENINFEKEKEFWNGFYSRQSSRECE
jgi:hypothetical protein